MQHGYTYADTLAASERINWRVEDLLGEGKTLDFGTRFMPETLARVDGLAFLRTREQMVLNQIRGHGYLYTFGPVEESQHAKLDTLMVEALAEACDEDEIGGAFDQYLEIGGMGDAGLQQQVVFDMEAFVRATGRSLTGEEQDTFKTVQTQGLRWTYLGSGMTHPNFLTTVEQIRSAARETIESVAPAFR